MLTAVLFRFSYPGPWGGDFTDAAQAIARDVAGEPGLVWKIWLEDRETGHAGGIYLFADEAAAARYRAKHEPRLAAKGFTGVTAHTYAVNAALSLMTKAEAALGRARPASSTARATQTAS
jgi:hypothetical protein